jgi:hypothetical protein
MVCSILNCYSLTSELHRSNQAYASYLNEINVDQTQCSSRIYTGHYAVFNDQNIQYYELILNDALYEKNKKLVVKVTVEQSGDAYILITDKQKSESVEKISAKILNVFCLMGSNNTIFHADPNSNEVQHVILSISDSPDTSKVKFYNKIPYFTISKYSKSELTWYKRSRFLYAARHLGFLVAIPSDIVVIPVSFVYFLFKMRDSHAFH